MLVLTRRNKDVISFPQVGITVHFLRVTAGQTKVGVDAPREIVIVRDNEESDAISVSMLERQLTSLPKQQRHDIRNDLHQLSVGLHLLRELNEQGLNEEATDIFESIQKSISKLSDNSAFNPPQSPATDPSQQTILLVEDQANEREMLAAVLRMQGQQVITLSCGDETIDYFHNNPAPGVMLIDMAMPEGDGPSTINTLRDENLLDKTVVFAISGTSPQSHGIPVGDAGVDRWFPKPLDPQTLLDSLPQLTNPGDLSSH